MWRGGLLAGNIYFLLYLHRINRLCFSLTLCPLIAAFITSKVLSTSTPCKQIAIMKSAMQMMKLARFMLEIFEVSNRNTFDSLALCVLLLNVVFEVDFLSFRWLICVNWHFFWRRYTCSSNIRRKTVNFLNFIKQQQRIQLKNFVRHCVLFSYTPIRWRPKTNNFFPLLNADIGAHSRTNVRLRARALLVSMWNVTVDQTQSVSHRHTRLLSDMLSHSAARAQKFSREFNMRCVTKKIPPLWAMTVIFTKPSILTLKLKFGLLEI